MYGTVKIYKDGNPLRPIISQIPTPIYDIAKQLNHIITPYIPSKYINSTVDFLQILRVLCPNAIIASLDVELLFANVPVLETIDIIFNTIYNQNNPQLPPPNIDRNKLSQLLLACTTKCPFSHINGHLYLQKDGVAMGSPLCVTFANFYMCRIEN